MNFFLLENFCPAEYNDLLCSAFYLLLNRFLCRIFDNAIATELAFDIWDN